MNKKGFTLVELLATLVILGIVVGIAIIGITGVFKNTKAKTENVFVSTLEDALDIYLDSDARRLSFSSTSMCTSKNIYESSSNLTFNDVINSNYSPLQENDLVNPANEAVVCNSNAKVDIYRDDNYVYYYKVNKNDFGCLKNSGYITNLPSECIG